MKKTKVQKIMTIDEKIKALQEEQKKLLNDLYLSVGKTVVNEWQSNDVESITNAIKKLKEEAQLLINESVENDSESLEDAGIDENNSIAN